MNKENTRQLIRNEIMRDKEIQQLSSDMCQLAHVYNSDALYDFAERKQLTDFWKERIKERQETIKELSK